MERPLEGSFAERLVDHSDKNFPSVSRVDIMLLGGRPFVATVITSATINVGTLHQKSINLTMNSAAREAIVDYFQSMHQNLEVICAVERCE